MLEFLAAPGPRERQLQRAHDNPLFSQFAQVSLQQLQQARQEDAAEVEEFMRQFQADIEQVVKLQAKADADDILAIKARLEALYTQACGIQGERDKYKDGLKKLLGLIANALIKAANNDAEAMSRINEDLEATELHLRISDSLLAADIINPQQPIPAEQLAPTLLSSSAEELANSLLLFAPEQLHSLIGEAEQVLQQSDDSAQADSEAVQRLQQMRSWYQQTSEQ